VIDEGLLNRMELAVRGETFDRRYLCAIGRRGEDKATVHAPPIQMDSTGAAFTEITAFLYASQLQVLAEQIEQRRACIDGHLVEAAADAQRDGQPRKTFHVLTIHARQWMPPNASPSRTEQAHASFFAHDRTHNAPNILVAVFPPPKLAQMPREEGEMRRLDYPDLLFSAVSHYFKMLSPLLSIAKSIKTPRRTVLGSGFLAKNVVVSKPPDLVVR
jgi:hypothetical protein